MSGPGSGRDPLPGLGSPQWSDNVGRMHAFTAAHPGMTVTVPMKNGTPDFIAAQDGEEIARDRSLGWLMDHLEKRFPGEPG